MRTANGTVGGSQWIAVSERPAARSLRPLSTNRLPAVAPVSFLLFSVVFFLLILVPTFLRAQETEVLDSVVVQEDEVPEQQSVGVNKPGDSVLADTVVIDMVAEDHLPRKAALYSAVLPGLGQIYNKKYWKLPILYGGFAILGYFVINNNDFYQILRRARFAEENSQRQENPLAGFRNGQFERLDALASQVNGARQSRDRAIIYTAALYGLNIMDAIVDAHLIEFDVNPDLSLKLEPTAGPRLAYYRLEPAVSYSGVALTLDIK